MYLAAILLAQGFHDVYFSTRGRRLCGPVPLFARVRRRLREQCIATWISREGGRARG